jgi:hypothetical protein
VPPPFNPRIPYLAPYVLPGQSIGGPDPFLTPIIGWQAGTSVYASALLAYGLAVGPMPLLAHTFPAAALGIFWPVRWGKSRGFVAAWVQWSPTPPTTTARAMARAGVRRPASPPKESTHT